MRGMSRRGAGRRNRDRGDSEADDGDGCGEGWMIRLATEDGWWLVTDPDHARLAGAFAERWGNAAFRRPEPRRQVLLGIQTHDDGWAARDAAPQITRQGLPSAFS